MFATLVPIFNQDMEVSAYSVFAQKQNYLAKPELLGVGANDVAINILGMEVIQNLGAEILEENLKIFVELNKISIWSDVISQCDVSPERLVFLIDKDIPPTEMYANRIQELKKMGFGIAVRKLTAQDYEEYREILKNTDYILLNYKKIAIEKAKVFFNKVYPNIQLCVVNIDTREAFEKLRNQNLGSFYEGEFFRVPVTKGNHEVAPLKVNYIELLNTVNNPNFELTEAADIIGRDTALVISLLKMVNRMTINSEITSIRHAAAMLGQKELKKWINTAVVNEIYADKPNEITRFSLLRAKFAENLAPFFEMASDSSELFLMGLFSILDVILDKPMKEALEIVKLSKEIKEALIDKKGRLAPVMNFIEQYENADWQEVSRLMILLNIDMDKVYEAYSKSLIWCRNLMLGRV